VICECNTAHNKRKRACCPRREMNNTRFEEGGVRRLVDPARRGQKEEGVGWGEEGRGEKRGGKRIKKEKREGKAVSHLRRLESGFAPPPPPSDGRALAPVHLVAPSLCPEKSGPGLCSPPRNFPGSAGWPRSPA
jgi:hypothetical protein